MSSEKKTKNSKILKKEVFLDFFQTALDTIENFFSQDLKKIVVKLKLNNLPSNLKPLLEDFLKKMSQSNLTNILKTVSKGLGITTLILKIANKIKTIREALQECDLHVMAKLPEKLSDYDNTYIFIEAEKKLFYIYKGKEKEVTIDPIEVFTDKLKKLKSKDDKYHLTNKNILDLITSNGGHAPPSKENIKSLPTPVFIFFTSLSILLKILKLATKPISKIAGNYLISFLSSFLKAISLVIAYFNEKNAEIKKEIVQNSLLNLLKLGGAALILIIALAGASFSPLVITILSCAAIVIPFIPKVVKFHSQHTELRNENALSSFLKFITASLGFLLTLNGFSLEIQQYIGVLFGQSFVESLAFIIPASFITFCAAQLFFNIMMFIPLIKKYTDENDPSKKILIKNQMFDHAAKTLGMTLFSVIGLFNPLTAIIVIGVGLAVYLGLNKFSPNWKENLMNLFSPKIKEESESIDDTDHIQNFYVAMSHISDSKNIQGEVSESDFQEEEGLFTSQTTDDHSSLDSPPLYAPPTFKLP